jgi:hypothetical protein
MWVVPEMVPGQERSYASATARLAVQRPVVERLEAREDLEHDLAASGGHRRDEHALSEDLALERRVLEDAVRPGPSRASGNNPPTADAPSSRIERSVVANSAVTTRSGSP